MTVTDDDGLTDTDNTTAYIGFGNEPIIVLTYPTEGDIIKDTITIEWTVYDSEDGTNLPIYLYLFDSDDTMTPFPDNPYNNTGKLSRDTTGYPDGQYKLLTETKDTDDNLGVGSCNFQIKNHEDPKENNALLKPSKPAGPASGKAGETYTYTTTTNDPEDDQIWFNWDFGDSSTSGWLGSYNTGETYKIEHQ